MPRFSALPLTLLLAIPLAPVAGQQMATAPVRVTTTAVSRVTLYRILPGQNAAFNRDVLENLIPIYEEYKKAGLIVDYMVFSKATTESAEDWNVGVTLTYANFAGLDNLFTRTDATTLKHYGTAEKRTAAGAARNQLRVVASSFLTQRLSYSR